MGRAIGGMDRHIAGVDLDQIMQDQHPDHPVDPHPGPGLIGKRHGIKRQVPAVFGGIFAPRAVAKPAGTQHRFQPVGLVEKAELGVKAMGQDQTPG
jgi:hypothetical protein